MKVSDMVFRVYVAADALDSTISFYETAQGVPCELRFAVDALRINGAKVGKVMILAGDPADLKEVNETQALCYVDSLDEFVPWLNANGAEIMSDANTNDFGTHIIVRNPDGLVAEYFEPRHN